MRPILVIHNNSRTSETISALIAKQMSFDVHPITTGELDYIDSIVDDKDAALLVIGLNHNHEIQSYLNKCRQLRVPYIFVKNELNTNYTIESILLPITNLEEEREKVHTPHLLLATSNAISNSINLTTMVQRLLPISKL